MHAHFFHCLSLPSAFHVPLFCPFALCISLFYPLIPFFPPPLISHCHQTPSSLLMFASVCVCKHVVSMCAFQVSAFELEVWLWGEDLPSALGCPQFDVHAHTRSLTFSLQWQTAAKCNSLSFLSDCLVIAVLWMRWISQAWSSTKPSESSRLTFVFREKHRKWRDSSKPLGETVNSLTTSPGWLTGSGIIFFSIQFNTTTVHHMT